VDKCLYELSASEIIRKINSQEVLISEVAEVFVKRINEVNPLVNAIQQFNTEKILSDAFSAQESFSPEQSITKQLFGLPISIKDAFHVKGFICSKGSLGLYGSKSYFDCCSSLIVLIRNRFTTDASILRIIKKLYIFRIRATKTIRGIREITL
jgi:Asp-tRNA(Asn)/Glu-tRNA(Gln) amidotransferase A subunit family amidase